MLGDRLPNIYDAEFQRTDKFESVEIDALRFNSNERVLNSLMNFKVLEVCFLNSFDFNSLYPRDAYL